MNSNSESNKLHEPLTTFNVIRNEVVTLENMGEFLGVTAFEQHAKIDVGDVISVVFFHNKLKGCSGTVTIWHNKDHAAIKTPAVSLCGDWHESQQLIVTEEEDVLYIHGNLVAGRLAMDINGFEGIYCDGYFFKTLAHCFVQ